MTNPSFGLINARSLVDCAMGRVPADLVIRNGVWVCVQTGELISGTDVAVKQGRVAYVGPDAIFAIGRETRVIDAAGFYLCPGLLDAHMHVESGMLTVTEFVRAVIVHGTTGMFIDPHEIANVFGLDGVRVMVDEAAVQPIHVWVQVPSCVPSAPDFETPGKVLSPAEVAEAMTWPGIIGLGEMMNFPGVFNGDDKVHAELEATRRAGKIIGGHYPSSDLGRPFHGYLAGGIMDDHEGTRLEDAVARARQGMKVMLRYGSAWHDVATQVRAITEQKLDPRNFLLCTDDSHSETLVHHGHMDRVIRLSISQGLPPITALQMATINTAEHFGLGREIGQIAPGRYADILIVGNLVEMDVKTVIARGTVVVEDHQILVDRPDFRRPEWLRHSVNLRSALKVDDFNLVVPESLNGKSSVTANVIGIIENQAPTRHLRLEVPVKDGQVFPDIPRDIAKVALIERHAATGRIQIGLVQGFRFNKPCAIGSTVAHDCHQMIVVGTDETSMALAANTLKQCGGGQVVVEDRKVSGLVELPVAGLMSEKPAGVVSEQLVSVLDGFKRCGCDLNNPNMQLSLLALVVIPALRISDKGLVDVTNFRFLAVLE
jgi:adenine deaminase